MSGKEHYILMADIIESREKEGVELMGALRAMVDHVNKTFRDIILSPFTITLGDEFQGVVKNIAAATHIFVYIEEYRIEHNLDFKLRYVVHYGNIESEINPKSSHAMLGAGFITARGMLERLKKNSSSRFYVEIGEEKKNKILNGLFLLYTTLVDSWNFDDNELIFSFIKNKDYKVVAREIKKDRANMWRREKTLRITDYLALKEIINNSV